MIATQSAHKPVLLEEAIANLAIDPAGLYIDGTFGGGGHSAAVLDRFPNARVIAFDRDPAAIDRAGAIADRFGPDRFQVVQAPFAEMAEFVAPAAAAGILLDL